MVMPLDLMEKQVGQNVSVLLKDGRLLRGRLAGFDPYMNMVLEETQEQARDDAKRTLGTLVLRGNNVVSVSPA